MKKRKATEGAEKASSSCLSDTESPKPAIQDKTSYKKTYADVAKGNISSSSTGNNHGQIPATSYAAEGKMPVQGSYHQGDGRFSINAGSQCVGNSFNAVVKSIVKSILTWNTDDIHIVLEDGNNLYSSLRQKGKIKS